MAESKNDIARELAKAAIDSVTIPLTDQFDLLR
jgi:hypothetical protein